MAAPTEKQNIKKSLANGEPFSNRISFVKTFLSFFACFLGSYVDGPLPARVLSSDLIGSLAIICPAY
jgi:hypothetical protein